ncbi:hypothetical protein [Actinoplanes sp. GCM10030250]|uniref:hypothetical protein n=1 Tax=Actinoplanes sp. GCM10030250 TaxID=3273376 RepID=UPI0036169753
MDDLAELTDAEVAAWAVAPSLPESVRSGVLEIVGDLASRHGRDPGLFGLLTHAWHTLGEQLQVSLWPGPEGSFGYAPEDLDPEWVAEVDFVIAEVNPIGEGLRFVADPYHQPADLPPGHVRLAMHCPDQSAAHVVTVPLERIPDLWARHPSLAEATYSLSPLAFLHPETLKWFPTGKIVVFALGGGTSFAEGVLAIQRDDDGDWLYHALLVERTWGIIAARPVDREGPIVLYPVLLSLWDEQLPAMARTLRLTYEPSAVRFFGGFPRYADVARFQRVFACLTHTTSDWNRLLAAVWLIMTVDSPMMTAAQAAEMELPGARRAD